MSKQDYKIQEVRVGQRKEDLSSVGDYYLNCGEVTQSFWSVFEICSFKKHRGGFSLRGCSRS